MSRESPEITEMSSRFCQQLSRITVPVVCFRPNTCTRAIHEYILKEYWHVCPSRFGLVMLFSESILSQGNSFGQVAIAATLGS